MFNWMAIPGLPGLGVSPTPLPIGSPALTCGVYKLTHEYANKIQPNLGEAQSKAVWDALGLDNCNETRPKPTTLNFPKTHHVAGYNTLRRVVDAHHGDDANDASEAHPMQSLEAAVARCRSVRSPTQPATIILREGKHLVRAALQLGAADSGLTIAGFEGERAEVSGAVPLGDLEWKPHDVQLSASSNAWRNVYVASVDRTLLPKGMTGLRVDGKRAIRARWPNGDPEIQLFPDGWSTATAWAPPRAHQPAEDIVVQSPNRSEEGPCTSSSGYCNYVTGVGGACASHGFDPPSGYWCNSDPPRGRVYSVGFPSGLTYPATAFEGRNWSSFKPNRTIINAFRSGHWFSYVFLVDSYDPATRRPARRSHSARSNRTWPTRVCRCTAPHTPPLHRSTGMDSWGLPGRRGRRRRGGMECREVSDPSPSSIRARRTLTRPRIQV